jgi:hypothetical protein
MPVNRFADMLSAPATATISPATVVPVGFALLPVFVLQLPAVQQVNPLQEIYRQAYEQAQAKARITRLEKRFFSVWN